MIDREALIQAAKTAQEKAYCPYSGFAVGAALYARSGQVYLGANIENASYSATMCAERVALFQAIMAGERNFIAIAIVGGAVRLDPINACMPCGVCRQVLAEFCGDDLLVLTPAGDKRLETRLGLLLPEAFRPESLQPFD